MQAPVKGLLTRVLKLELSDEQWASFAGDTLKRGDKAGRCSLTLSNPC